MNNRRNWDLEVDVLVIGSGAAGLQAAIKAVEGGTPVIGRRSQLRTTGFSNHRLSRWATIE